MRASTWPSTARSRCAKHFSTGVPCTPVPCGNGSRLFKDCICLCGSTWWLVVVHGSERTQVFEELRHGD